MTAGKTSLCDLFIAFAADAAGRIRTRPLRIVDMNDERVYTVTPDDGAGFRLTVDNAAETLRNNPDFLDMQDDKSLSSFSLHKKGARSDVIFINDRVPAREQGALSATTEAALLATLDHELAHLTIRGGDNAGGGLDDILLAECIADAYALLRHYQRFGTDAPLTSPCANPLARADNMIFHNDRFHATTFMLQEIIARKDQIDVAHLTPQQTADLARSFALAYAPSAALVQDVYDALKPVRTAAAPRLENGMRALVDIVLAPACDDATFRLGAFWLTAVLETRTLPNGKPLHLPADYLNDVKIKLAAREDARHAKNILAPPPAPE